MSIRKVTIIGAGLSGLTLAIFLKKQDLDVTIFELRPADVTSEGAIMLSPNALKTLDAVGVLDRIVSKGYLFRDLNFVDGSLELMDTYEMGNKDRFGYDALRVYRQVILNELRAMVTEAGVPVTHGKKFSHVVAETDDGVTFAFADGEQVTTDLLIGADGIHSKVREHIAPGVKSVFGGVMAITAAVPTDKVKLPFSPPFKQNQMPLSIHGPGGAFVLAPQNPEGSELLAGIQHRTHDRTRQEWDALWADKEQLHAIMKKDYESWNDVVTSAMDAVPLHTMSIWPFFSIPALPSWRSELGRVVILGDAAHAISPAAGQGVNQAFEDVHSIALLLQATNAGQVEWQGALRWWQDYRQARVDCIKNLTDAANRRRLRGFDFKSARPMDSGWVFDVDIPKDVAGCVDAQRS